MADVDYAPVAARLAALAQGDPDREVCGFVTADLSGAVHVVPVRNLAGEAGWAPGARSDPRLAYLADPAAHLALSRRLRLEGGRLLAVYHSHVEASAVLSAVDLEQAICEGAPMLPGVDQVVIGMLSGKVTEIRVFRWRGESYHGSVVPLAG